MVPPSGETPRACIARKRGFGPQTPYFDNNYEQVRCMWVLREPKLASPKMQNRIPRLLRNIGVHRLCGKGKTIRSKTDH